MNQEMICSHIRKCDAALDCVHARFHTITGNCGLRLCTMNNGNRLAVHCSSRGELRFQKGDRVIFRHNINQYIVGDNNPLVGSKHFCKGTVLVDDGRRVQWDNGKENSYDSEDLDFAASYSESQIRKLALNPNMLFKLRRKLKNVKS